MDNVVQLRPESRSCWICLHSSWGSDGPFCHMIGEPILLSPQKVAADCEVFERDEGKE